MLMKQSNNLQNVCNLNFYTIFGFLSYVDKTFPHALKSTAVGKLFFYNENLQSYTTLNFKKFHNFLALKIRPSDFSNGNLRNF